VCASAPLSAPLHIVVKCISSIENPMGTLLSSSCQLRLEGDLSHLG